VDLEHYKFQDALKLKREGMKEELREVRTGVCAAAVHCVGGCGARLHASARIHSVLVLNTLTRSIVSAFDVQLGYKSGRSQQKAAI
jgi:hypothetical protein